MAVAEFKIEGAVRHVRLTRPEKRNALNPEMISILTEAFTIPPKPGERLVLVEAEGTVFSAGIDLRERDGTQRANTKKFMKNVIENSDAFCKRIIIVTIIKPRDAMREDT